MNVLINYLIKKRIMKTKIIEECESTYNITHSAAYQLVNRMYWDYVNEFKMPEKSLIAKEMFMKFENYEEEIESTSTKDSIEKVKTKLLIDKQKAELLQLTNNNGLNIQINLDIPQQEFIKSINVSNNEIIDINKEIK